RALAAGHDRLDQLGARSEGRRHLSRLEDTEPPAGAGADEDDSTVLPERVRNDLDADRDALLLAVYRRQHFAIFVEHPLDDIRRRELVDGERRGIDLL